MSQNTLQDTSIVLLPEYASSKISITREAPTFKLMMWVRKNHEKLKK
jgi:hypothetical protein